MLVTHRPSVVLTRENVDAFLFGLEPGDLIFSMRDASKVTDRISRYQQDYGYAPRASDASHVAIYLGDHSVIHAVFPRVSVVSVSDYFMGREVCSGRWRATSPLDRAFRGHLLCKAAASFVGRPYETINLFRQVALSNLAIPPLVCSTFVDLAFDAVFGARSPIHSGPGPTAPFITPAHIFSRQAFL